LGFHQSLKIAEIQWYWASRKKFIQASLDSPGLYNFGGGCVGL
jgi:hypothetical protein